MRRPAVVLLAAGRASRYQAAGGQEPTKLLAPWRGSPLVRHAAQVALASRGHPVIVVTGHAAEAVAAVLADLPLVLVHNAGFAEGIAASLRAGVAALPAACPGAVVMLADMPGVTTATLDVLLDHALAHPEADAVVPLHDGRRGNPVLLARSLFPAVRALRGDVGARELLRAPGLRVAEIAVTGDVRHDIDVPADLGASPFTKP